MTMAQSTIAGDLDAYEDAMWFTSSYLISMSALSPLTGRLAAIFSARTMVLNASIFFAIGGSMTASAQTFAAFIAGRVVSGIGAAGIMVLAIILVLELTNKKQRGLFIGLVNAGFTVGVSLGAIVYGAVVPSAGWVSVFLGWCCVCSTR
jgi:MFS family permease